MQYDNHMYRNNFDYNILVRIIDFILFLMYNIC